MDISHNSDNERDSLRNVLHAALSNAVTIGEAAQILGITTRAVQRRIDNREIKSIEVDGTRFVCLSTPAPPVFPPPAQLAPVRTPPFAPPIPIAPAQPATAPASTPTNSFADDMAVRYVSQLERENAFLRSQIEAHARAEAELRAALREAMHAMPKALTEGMPVRAAAPETPTPREEPVAPPVSPPISPPAEVAAVDTTPPQETPTEELKPREEIPTESIASEPVNGAPPAEKPEQVQIAEPPAAEPPHEVEPLAEKPAEVVIKAVEAQASVPTVSAPVASPASPPDAPAGNKHANLKRVKIVPPPLSPMLDESKGTYKSVHDQFRSPRPLWKIFLGMR